MSTSLIPPQPRPVPFRARLIDCGEAGFLTGAEVALRAGIAIETVRSRLESNWPPDRMLETAYQHHAGRDGKSFRAALYDAPSGTRHGGLLLAARVALRYRGHAPTVEQLVADFGMSRATAYRWRGAFLDAGAEG